ncbi:hypothetical protein T484DRAFT_1806838, partial [Baffinella frigidus]
ARARTANTEARLLIVVDAPFAGRWVQARLLIVVDAPFAGRWVQARLLIVVDAPFAGRCGVHSISSA